MKTFLVAGLESSCTRYVSIMIATNLGIVGDGEVWDGHERIKNDKYMVVHKSLPHGGRDSFIDEIYCRNFDKVVLCTRDIGCSLISKMKHHQRDKDLAVLEQEKGRNIMFRIVRAIPNVEIYSYESAFTIGQAYNERFMRLLGIPYAKAVDIMDINSKYLK